MHYGLGSLFGAFGTTVIILVVVFFALLIIANWQMFVKAGEKGWKALIPFYSDYILYKITWKGFIGIIFDILLILSSVVDALNQTLITSIITLAIVVANTVLHAIQCHKHSRAFEHGTGYGFGLFFLPNVFTLILGFGRSKYVRNTNK